MALKKTNYEVKEMGLTTHRSVCVRSQNRMRQIRRNGRIRGKRRGDNSTGRQAQRRS